MEAAVQEIFATLGGITAIANGIDARPQTVSDWLNKGKAEIPPWRRQDVLRFATDSGKLTELSHAALLYLQSQERTVGRAAA